MDKIYKAGNSFCTEEERNILISNFKDNEKLLNIIRKMLVPKVDPDRDTPLIDVYNAIPFSQLSPEECKIQGTAREALISHINSVLNTLWNVANTMPKTKEEIEEAMKKDSNK